MLEVFFSDWVSFLAYPNLFGIKGFFVVVVVQANIGRSFFITSCGFEEFASV
jgi:hypothetical protein